MVKKRVIRNHSRTADEVQRDQQLREEFQSRRPTLDQLLVSGDYTAPLPQGELLSLLEFAAAIRETRKLQGLSLADVSRISGIDRAAISRLESGLVENPTFGTLERIANALGKHVRLALDDSGTSAATAKR